MSGSARLGPAERAAAWHRLRSEEFDVLVVGGGVTGAGTALDAATRGLRVALVEARDFASGTSSRSSKLLHGGLRYLEQLNFDLVREALRERGLMLNRIAPHLVRPVPILYPLTHPIWERPYVGAGLVLYDTMGGARSLPWHRHLTRTGARKLCPAIRRSALTGGMLYHDAQVDDARHTLTVVRTASAYGAAVLSSAEVVAFTHAGERVTGAVVRDVETGDEVEVHASVVVNATGVWTDEVQALAGGRGRFHVRASKGVHIVVPRDRIPSEVGLVLRTEKSVLFMIPWTTHWLIGTTDTDWNLDLAHPAASRADVDYLLDHINRVLSVPLTRDDIQGVYAGLRPLLAGESEETSQLSREHAVARPQPGLVSIAGGKYTTYRVMAADAVDLGATDIGRAVPDSPTANIPLVGAEGYHALVNQIPQLASSYGLPGWQIERLVGRYGSLTTEVLEQAGSDESLLRPMNQAQEYLGVEIAYAASHEAALHLDDVLTRRTRASIETPDRGTDAAAAAARIVAPLLGWDDDRVDNEVQAYAARVKAERESQEQADDLAADAARVAAPDTRKVAVGRALQ
ncbi:MAG: FAD-dependent oxidoreductase [Propionibacteriales bacterium]|nr:FAD-dependent oxidoreductase [Propionibacteriales bacterium]